MPACRTVARALYESQNYQELIDLLRNYPDLVAQSDYLQGVLAWAYYRTGDLRASSASLATLRHKREDANDRVLHVSLAITAGDWSALLAFTEREWEKRDERTGEDLLRAGQLAQQLGSARGKDLIHAAALKANETPEILLGCYSAAVSGG